MIVLTDHARRRVAGREVAEAWVERVVAAPDWTEADPDPQLTRSFKAIAERGGRVLRVVHRSTGHDILVVTAFFDRDARP